ncbi:MAG: hypothetical protein ABIR68_16780, partial [Ilumatobacteraceae bacterium]
RYSRTSNGRMLVTEIVRGIRWRHIWPVPLVLAGVIAVATPLLAVPGLDWGWWSALGGEGNPVFGSSSATTGSAWEWLVPLLFVCLLIPALPLFAHAEEVMFRRGAEGWSTSRRVVKVVQFGLIHVIIGIPIAVALALSVGGAAFMAAYLRAIRRGAGQRGATIESARAHTAYNGLLIAAVLVTVVLTAIT